VSVAMVPIQAADRVRGVLTVATGPSRRGPRPSDVVAFEELGRRLAFAMEQAEVHRALLAARAQAAELEGARRIAHDFGNLLTRMVGYAELAERRLLAGEAEEALQDVIEIRAAAEAAVHLTRAPVFGADPSGTANVTEAGDVVTALEPTLRVLAGGHALRIAILGPAPVPFQDSGVEHIVRNLVANAAHAIAERGGAGTIEVAIGPAPDRPGHTAIRVTDDGIGMEPHLLAACRADGFTTRAANGGTGRGLTMVDWLVHNADGELQIDSQPGAGTTVTAVLPHPPAS
jgi:signal transduction histidine kinase